MQFESEQHRANFAELRDRAAAIVAGAAGGDYPTGINGVRIHVRDASNGTGCTCYEPSVSVILRGRKRSICGERSYEYGQSECIVTGVDVPSRFEIIRSDPSEIFMGISLSIDKELMTELIAQMPLQATGSDEDCSRVRAFVVAASSDRVTEGFLNLMRLLDRPEEVALRTPGLVRDIYCLLLLGDTGPMIKGLYTKGSSFNRISQAITWLRDNYREPLSVERLADSVHMSTSSFHRHFKEITSISPLQYHKRLRLYEAQRLLVAEGIDVNSAAYSVGYMSPTQFSREYKALFGLPPGKDASARRVGLH
jgi:AraC-like DNA-binding protein